MGDISGRIRFRRIMTGYRTCQAVFRFGAARRLLYWLRVGRGFAHALTHVRLCGFCRGLSSIQQFVSGFRQLQHRIRRTCYQRAVLFAKSRRAGRVFPNVRAPGLVFFNADRGEYLRVVEIIPEGSDDRPVALRSFQQLPINEVLQCRIGAVAVLSPALLGFSERHCK